MKIGFFEELKAPGIVSKSSVRLQMFITMFYAFAVIGYQAYVGSVDIVLASFLLGAAFAPKVVSKFAENTSKK